MRAGPRPEGLHAIREVAYDLGLGPDVLEPWGRGLAKIPATLLPSLERSSTRRAKVVLVTSMSPTPHGEGKTVTSIGLAMALRKLGYRSTVCLRQPSLGPTLGLKGGGAGGGAATVEPATLLNLGFPGDTLAVSSAHNLLSALLDNRLHHASDPRLDPDRVLWPRTLDMEDRALRRVRVGLGEGKGSGPPRDDGFVIAAASEVMAILGLASDFADLKARLGRITVGYGRDGAPVTASDLRAQGAMTALLRDAFHPNLVQTCEGTPAFVHTGPFANLGHGTASLISIRMARATSEVCLVEAGFGTDLGAEKFMDIVSPLASLPVSAAVVVVSLPALRYHGGADETRLHEPAIDRLERGFDNLEKHLENLEKMGLNSVVALNRFPGDSPEEIRELGAFCGHRGIAWAESTAFTEGSGGAVQLAEVLLDATRRGSSGHPIYPAQMAPEEKLALVAREMYGAEGVDFSEEALKDLEAIHALGLGTLPLSVAKTPLSLSDDPHVRGRPRGFRLRVHRLLPRTGAGIIVATTGDILLMPGLPKEPAAWGIDVSDSGEITGVH